MSFRKILLSGIALFVVAGGVACQLKPVTPPPSKSPVTRQPPKIVDTQAQQLHYDRGIRAYSNENFEEAKAAFQRVISLGPKTELGLKARENLNKVIQVLKTVEEIKSK